MKTTAILVAVAMIAMATPTNAVEEVDNRVFFETVTEEAYEQFKQSKEYFLLSQNPDFELPENFDFEAASWAEALSVLEARAGERDMAELFANGDETGAFPQASDFFELFEISVSSANECPTPDVQEASPAPGAMTWSYGSAEYVGLATSSVSTLGSGFFYDYSTGKGFPYSQAVTYGGVSDMFCFAFDFFGIFLTYNWPYATGVAVDGL